MTPRLRYQFAPLWASFADKQLGNDGPMNTGTLLFNIYEPRGVMGAITPGIFRQSMRCTNSPGPCGRQYDVLKPSELSSGSALKLANWRCKRAWRKGVDVVPGLGATVGTALAIHLGCHMLTFTGSTANGP